MYQLLIEDKHNKIRYVSSCVLLEKNLNEIQIKQAAQMEHLQRNPDDKMLEIEYLNEIFEKISIIGLIPVNFKTVQF